MFPLTLKPAEFVGRSVSLAGPTDPEEPVTKQAGLKFIPREPHFAVIVQQRDATLITRAATTRELYILDYPNKFR